MVIFSAQRQGLQAARHAAWPPLDVRELIVQRVNTARGARVSALQCLCLLQDGFDLGELIADDLKLGGDKGPRGVDATELQLRICAPLAGSGKPEVRRCQKERGLAPEDRGQRRPRA
jgi:hypothetical protein